MINTGLFTLYQVYFKKVITAGVFFFEKHFRERLQTSIGGKSKR
jgi:hypothetical protein